MKINVKRLDLIDIGLIKIAVVSSVLAIIRIFPTLMEGVHNTKVMWFIIIAIIASIRPLRRAFK